MQKKYVLSIMFLFAAVFFLSADSPLTSTPFSDVYSELSIIRNAKVKGILNLEMAEYLSSGSVPIDLKAALINALSWDINGKSNSRLYSYYLSLKYGKSIESLEIPDLSNGELFSLGYLKAMDNYFYVGDSLLLLEKVREKMDKSMTVALIYSLVLAQNIMESQSWNGIYPLFQEVINDSSLINDIRPEAVAIILDYIGLYR